MTVTLYRATDAVEPYFGTNSHWTASPHYARAFADHVAEHPAWPDSLDVYQAEADVSSAVYLGKIPSKVAHQLVKSDSFGADCRWVSFIETRRVDVPPNLASLVPVTIQYVYLGAEPIVGRP